MHHRFASRFGRVVTAGTFAVVFSAACGGGESPSVTCGEVSSADLDSGILTAVFTNEFEERGVDATPERLQAARATLTGLCAEGPDRKLFDSAVDAAAEVAERAEK
ncbi:MAG: hypothetical protein M3O70_02295 [Actinomycetota bacterium]|nr:hypothetical protein [Actinomycetota bacterium]